MKKTLSLLLIILSSAISVQSQGSIKYSVKVINKHSSPMKSLALTFKESVTKEKIVKYTNKYGEASIELNRGKNWWLSVGKMYKYRIIEVPELAKATDSELITYNLKRWERENRPMPDRSKISFTSEKQTIKSSHKPTKTHTIVELVIKKRNNHPLTSFPIQLTCIKAKMQYLTKTDHAGKARFFVPIKSDYEIDIDGIESYRYIDVGEYPGIDRVRFVYEPTNIKEKIKNDTVFQDLPETSTPTSTRVLYIINVKDAGGSFLKNEYVYLDLIHSKKVYTAKTNENGAAVFLLPIKKKYMLNFEFQKDIDVINLMRIKGIGKGYTNVVYRPSHKLKYPEEYIPTSEELIITEFNEFITKQIPPPEEGKNLKLIYEWGNNTINKKSKEAVLKIGLSATNDESNKSGPPVNVAFVMDKSGSMAGHDRIDQLKVSLVKFISSLRTQDIASLIIFESDPEILLEAGVIGSRKEEFVENINQIEAGGGTNIYKGMVLGYEEVLKNMNTKATNRVILLTDGYGITEVGVITTKSKEYNDKGVELSAIGVGADYNQALLKILATTGEGMFRHVEDAYNLEKSFNNELKSLMYPIATNVFVEIQYNEKIIFKHLFGSNFKNAGTNKVKLKLNNIYRGYKKIALAKFDLKIPDKTIEKKPVIIRMNYFDYRLNKPITITEKAFLKWNESSGKLEMILEAEMKKLYAIAVMNQSLKVMADAFSNDDFKEAQAVINRAVEQIKELYPKAKQEDVDKLYKSLKEYSNILAQYIKNKIRKRSQ